MKNTVEKLFGHGWVCKKCGKNLCDYAKILKTDIRSLHAHIHEKEERGHITIDKAGNYSGDGFLWDLWKAIEALGTAKENIGYGDGSFQELETTESSVYNLLKTLEFEK